MSERRPRWTDALVEAVRSKIGIHQHGPIGEIRIYNPFDDEVYNVIAAVEDWQEARWGPECWVTTAEDAKAMFLYRAQTAEAKIQAVRDILDAEQRGYNPPLGLIARIVQALDGERDE